MLLGANPCKLHVPQLGLRPHSPNITLKQILININQSSIQLDKFFVDRFTDGIKYTNIDEHKTDVNFKLLLLLL